MNTITIDLRDCYSADSIFWAFDQIFHFGGKPPEKKFFGNAGWGQNWHAFKDSLTYIDSGGIQGTSPPFRLPIHLHIIYGDLRQTSHSGLLWTLYETLKDVRKVYHKNGDQLSFSFEYQSSNIKPSLRTWLSGFLS